MDWVYTSPDPTRSTLHVDQFNQNQTLDLKKPNHMQIDLRIGLDEMRLDKQMYIEQSTSGTQPIYKDPKIKKEEKKKGM